MVNPKLKILTNFGNICFYSKFQVKRKKYHRVTCDTSLKSKGYAKTKNEVMTNFVHLYFQAKYKVKYKIKFNISMKSYNLTEHKM